MLPITSPSPTALQLSAPVPDHPHALVVLAKRTYAFSTRARCAVAPEQLPLRTAGVFDDARRGLLIADMEIYPFKHLTDVVVRGHAYAYRAVTHARAEVRVGPFVKALDVWGDRRCTRASDGQIHFSRPTPFEKIPLTYGRAYGGWDERTEQRRGNPLDVLAPWVHKNTDLSAYSPFVYPRNRHGRGYIVDDTREGLEELELPNLEDPADALTPERLVVGHPFAWHKMPLPACTTWVPPSYFGRGAFLGMIPFWQPLPPELPEFERSLLPREVAEIGLPDGKPMMMRFTNGASLGLQVPYLQPGDAITLENLHPEAPSLTIALPDDRPVIFVDGRNGKLLPTEPAVHHVEIEPDLGRLSIVWRGYAPALRAYMPEELSKMPFRVEWRMS